MGIKFLWGTVCAVLLSFGLVTNEVNAETLTINEYLVPGVPGDSWTYTYTYGPLAGTDFTVTEPPYSAFISLFPSVAETGQLIEIEPCIYMYLDIVGSLTVPAGTFKNVLRMTWLDCNFPANLMNASLGINPSINMGVTDVDWFAVGVGEIQYLGVMAENGLIDGGYVLKSYSVDYAAPGWTAIDFHTLSTPTRAIEFDSLGNLYIENTMDDESGFIDILKLDASSGFSTQSIFATYSTAYKGATGLDFDGLGSLYVSERSVGGDAGIIRKIDVVTKAVTDVMSFANHRPTGIDADTAGNVFYSGRRESNGTWGKIFKIDPSIIRTELSASTVATGIALDTYGNIFISTPQRTDLPLLSNSIYMFRSSDVGLLNPILIGTFKQRGGELTFDDTGNLYMIAEDQVSIIKISPDDADSDGIPDYMDNCTLVSNSSQLDTDNDGFGNICDADLNGDLLTNLSDFSYFRIAFSTTEDPDADFDGDGSVDLTDFSLFRVMFGSPPGPSGLNP